MKFFVLNPENLPLFLERIQSLQSDTPRRWGTMSPHKLLAHLRRTLEVSLGEHPAIDRSVPLLSPILRWLTFETPLPWPKGKIKAPADWTPEPEAGFEEERTRLLTTLQRFVETAAREPQRKGVSPLFGPLPLATWQRIHGRHMEHHFQQFGI